MVSLIKTIMRFRDFFFFFPATRVSFCGGSVRETYIQLGMALLGMYDNFVLFQNPNV